MERIFGLDFQLLHDALWTALAIFILFFALSYLLFNPVRKMLADRRKKIQDEMNDAETHLKEAETLKNEYEEKISSANEKSQEILDAARKKAKDREQEILLKAEEEATLIRRRAEKDIELEKAKACDEVKTYVADMASEMAEKLIGEKLSAKTDESIIDGVLNDIGEDTWQDR